MQIVKGDPLLTQAQTLAVGHNARGRTELRPFDTAARRKIPPAFAAYRRNARRGRSKPGTLWLWTQSRPRLLFMTVRASSVGMMRLRYVQTILITLIRDYKLYGITSLAVAPLGEGYDQAAVLDLTRIWLAGAPFPVIVYETYIPDQPANEQL